MKKTLLAVTLAALTSGAATTAMAADPKASAPDFEISGNFGLFSDYRFRGISQTENKPAAQGGFDFTHKSGLYIGTWTSNIDSVWTASGSSQEIDLYGGYRFSVGEFGLDAGAIAYRYPGNNAAVKNNTDEVYLGISYVPISYKVSRTLSNWFGINANSDGSVYQDLTLSHALSESIALAVHAGHQSIKGGSEDFNDYSISAAYDLGDGYTIKLTASTVDFKNSTAGQAWFNSGGTKLYEDTAVISLSKTF
jgi:uncharacterized protein (TIGR02001 family)